MAKILIVGDDRMIVKSDNKQKLLINAVVWQNLIDLEIGGNPGFVNELINTYISSVPGVTEELKIASNRGAFKKLQDVAHLFKSSCHSVGALDLADELDKIEADAKKATPTVNRQLVEEVLAKIKLVAAELESRRR